MINEKIDDDTSKNKGVYSHSKLSTFEQCKLKFKLKYIDKLKPEIEKSIESHLGTCVHDSLEWLYNEIKRGIIPTLDSLIIHYTNKWQKEYNSEILIVKNSLTQKDYFNKGIRFLLDYYSKNHPFNDNTIELEKKVEITIKQGKHKLMGFIDRLAYNLKTGEYEIHDYKTSGTLPTKEKIGSDRQLALYSIAIKEIYGEDKEVTLNWHFLDFNQKISIKKSAEDLEKLKEDTAKLIDEIELSKDFPANPTKLCDWCEFRKQCPYWKGKETKNPNEELKDNSIGKKEKERYPTLSKYLKS